MNQQTQNLMVAATDVAASWDKLHYFLIALSAVFFVLVVGGMIWFLMQYWHKKNPKADNITGHHTLEIAWTVVPTVLLLVIFAWGFSVWKQMIQAPADSMEVRVIGKQWLWQFQYLNGRTTTGELFVPVNKPVKLVMTSDDVIHSFFVPNFRIKQDVVPGMYTTVWFEATVPGTHQVFCTEYCGTAHSGMLAKVHALTPDQWAAWNEGKKIENLPIIGVGREMASKGSGAAAGGALSPLAEQGKKIYESRACASCHSVDGSPKVGPTLKGVFGTEVELTDGTKVKIDENYIRESIENPNAKVVKGFGPLMPTFKGQINETELNALITYIKGLK